jgi:potassium channel subfamily K, other eukaryote
MSNQTHIPGGGSAPPPPRPPRLNLKPQRSQGSRGNVTLAQFKRDQVRSEWKHYRSQKPESAHYIGKLLRYLVKKDEVSDKSARQKAALYSAMYNILFLIITAGTLVGLIERWRFVDSLWWAYVTLSTIGYGDTTPTKDASLIITCFFIIYGVGILSNALSTVAAYWKAKKEEAHLALQLEEERELRLMEEAHTLKPGTPQTPRTPNGKFTQKVAEVGVEKVERGNEKSLRREEVSHSKVNNPISRRTSSNFKFAAAMAKFLILLLVGSMFLVLSEGWSVGDGFYFALETATTIGYG